MDKSGEPACFATSIGRGQHSAMRGHSFFRAIARPQWQGKYTAAAYNGILTSGSLLYISSLRI